MSQEKEEILPNVLAERYASPAMRAVWSPAGRIRQERDLWIAVMKAQRDLGLEVPEEAIAAYEAVRDQVDLASIDRRERDLLHDVKARIEEFSALSGHERIHLGMASRDLTASLAPSVKATARTVSRWTRSRRTTAAAVTRSARFPPRRRTVRRSRRSRRSWRRSNQRPWFARSDRPGRRPDHPRA